MYSKVLATTFNSYRRINCMTKIHLIIVAAAVLIASAMVAMPQTPRVTSAIKGIPTKGKSTKDFVPKGWEIYNEAKGDLNGDVIADAALTLTLPLDEAEKLRDATGDNYESAPSITVILFGNKDG